MFHFGVSAIKRRSTVTRMTLLSSVMLHPSSNSNQTHSRTSSTIIMSTEETTANESAAFEHVHYKRAEDPNAPLVVLFGWAGCHDRYLTKYSQMYEKKLCSVARYTAPIAKIRSFSSYRAFALGVYEKILDNDDKEPLIFHVFSMNGCSLFVALWDLLDTLPNGADVKARTKGIIFDSCPANVLPWQAANAISFATLPPSKFGALPRNSYRVVLAGFFASHRAIVWLQSFFDASAFETNYAYFRMLKIMDLPKQQLYLFSNNDDICSDHSIENFQKVQQERGASVTSKCWTDSLHVQHLRSHPDEYAELCDRFISDTFIELTPRHSA